MGQKWVGKRDKNVTKINFFLMKFAGLRKLDDMDNLIQKLAQPFINGFRVLNSNQTMKRLKGAEKQVIDRSSIKNSLHSRKICIAKWQWRRALC